MLWCFEPSRLSLVRLAELRLLDAEPCRRSDSRSSATRSLLAVLSLISAASDFFFSCSRDDEEETFDVGFDSLRGVALGFSAVLCSRVLVEERIEDLLR